jgi:TolB-like protein/Tfp pilus assembly protein PilF
VLSDPEVGGNSRRAKLLRHLVGETLAGRAESLRGTAIAMDVFDRGAGFDPQTDAIVRAEARRLRQALASYYAGPGARDPLMISIPKGGYVPRFVVQQGSVDTALTATGSGAGAASEPGRPTPASRGDRTESLRDGSGRVTRGRVVLGTAVLAGLALIVALAIGSAERGRGVDDASKGMTPTVLVTPFEAAGSADDIEALASGITAQLIADLMRFPGFRLFSLERSLSLAKDPAAQAKAGEAAFIVRGLVRGDGDALWIAARLIRTSDGAVIWSDTFSRPLEPRAIIGMQADIVGRIAAKIAAPDGVVRAGMSEDAAAAAGMRSFACVMEAYSYRLANRRDLYPTARECLEAAVAREPDYAEAWALLAFLRLDGGRFGYEAQTAEARQQAYAAARAAAARALTLDARNSLAYGALAQIEHYAGRFEESLRYSLEALDANPNDPTALALHGWRLSLRGRFEEGLPYLERAIERSATPPAWLFHPIALARLSAGDFEGLLTAAERAAVDGSAVSDAFLAIAYAGLGRTKEAQAALDRIGGKWPLLARDPAAAFGIHNVHPDLITSIMDGLRAAGWTPPLHAAAPG